MNSVLVFNGTKYYISLIIEQSKTAPLIDVDNVDFTQLNETTSKYENVVFKFEGHYFAIAGSKENFTKAKLLSKHQLKFCKKDEADLRSSISIQDIVGEDHRPRLNERRPHGQRGGSVNHRQQR